MREHMLSEARHPKQTRKLVNSNRIGMNAKKGPAIDLVTALIDQGMEKHQANLERWKNSPFAGVREIPVQSRGIVVGEGLAHALLTHEGLEVGEPYTIQDGNAKKTLGYDMTASGLGRVEVKASTEGMTGRYAWGSMRPTKADNMLILGLQPEGFQAWLIPSDRLNRLYGLKLLGKGISGLTYSEKTQAFSIGFKAGETPDWLNAFGGTDESFSERVQREARRRGPR